MSEVELKFLIDEDQGGRILRRVSEIKLADGRKRSRTLRSIYYDTPERSLRAAGITLRVRRDGRRWLQTVKSNGTIASGLSQSGEFETPITGGKLTLEAISDDRLRSKIEASVNGQELMPVVETQFRRTSLMVGFDGTKAELAIDDGEIRAGDRSGAFHEAELELAEGSASGLYRIARQLMPDGGVRFSRYSKAARGELLAQNGFVEPPLSPRKAKAVPLGAEQTSEQAARDVLRECLDQIATNVIALRELDDPEGPHQLRVGLRRLRSAFSAFKPVLGGSESKRLSDEARWLGKEVGVLRDLDVARTDVLKPHAARHPKEAGFEALDAALAEASSEVRLSLRELLRGERVQTFVFDLSEYIETRGWLDPADFDQSAELARPVRTLADTAIAKRWKHAAVRAQAIDALHEEERHALRKELKKLRYAIEFFNPLYPDKKTKPFIKRLKALQSVFGDLNDAAMARTLFTGSRFAAIEDAACQRAIGIAIGASAERADASWPGAVSLWNDLEGSKRFWT